MNFRRMICLVLAVLMLGFSGAEATSAEVPISADFLWKLGSYDRESFQEELEEAIEKWQLSEPNYEKYDREPDTIHEDMILPRYMLCEDGIYRNQDEIPGDTVTIDFTGDLMCQTRQQLAAMDACGEYNFRDSFRYIRDFFSDADLVVGNLETVLSESASYMSEEPKVDDLPHLNAPATYLDALRYAGFDMLVTANNHNYDCGVTGIFETKAHLDEYGFASTGIFRGSEEQRFTLFEVKGMKIAILAYTTKFNKTSVHLTPEGKRTMLNEYSRERMQADVKKARAAGAEFIIAYNHWGVEYSNTVESYQEDWAREMADCGADYIIGSHPHALQRYGRIKAADGRIVPVLYSMGNFVSHGLRTVSQQSIVLQVTLRRNDEGKIEIDSQSYLPCITCESFGGVSFAVLPVSYPYAVGDEKELYGQSYDEIVSVIGRRIPVLGYKVGGTVNIVLEMPKPYFLCKYAQ